MRPGVTFVSNKSYTCNKQYFCAPDLPFLALILASILVIKTLFCITSIRIFGLIKLKLVNLVLIRKEHPIHY